MFYLIGGAPRSGKTIMAGELSRRLNIPWISTDTLESVVSGYVSSDELGTLFPKSLLRKITHQSNDELYTKYTSEQIVEAYIQQGKNLGKAIEIFLESESQYNHDYILEGYHILPALVSKLEEKFKIKAIFIGREDASKTLEAITKNFQQNDWVEAKTKSPEIYSLIAEMICAFSSYLKEDAKQNNYPYVSMDDNFTATMEKLVKGF